MGVSEAHSRRICIPLTLHVCRIDANGEFLPAPISQRGLCSKEEMNVGVVIKKELSIVQDESNRRIDKLRYATDIHIGK